MNKTLESVKRERSIYLSDNQSASMVIPEKEQDQIIYKYFSYLSFEDNGVLKIYKICNMFGFNELNEKVEQREMDKLENIIEINGIKPISFSKTLEIQKEYYNKLDNILSILYKNELTEEEKIKVEEFKIVFDRLIVEDMKKVYNEYFPNFMNWIENI